MAVNHRTIGQQKRHYQPSVAILFDIQNVFLKQKQAESLLAFAKSQGRLICQSLYYNSQHKNQVIATNKLENLGFQCFDVPDSSKNSADKQLVFDCTKLFAAGKPAPAIIILVLGDRDFAGLITMLIAMRKQVIIFARRKSTSKKVINLVGDNNFHDVDELSSL